jgi:D-amino-acid dehydrogenase
LATPAALKEGATWLLRDDGPLGIRPRAAVMPWLMRFAMACREERAREAKLLLAPLSLESLRLHASLSDEGIDTGFCRRGIVTLFETPSAYDSALAELPRHLVAGVSATPLSREEAGELMPGLRAEGIAGGVHFTNEAHCEPERFVRSMASAAAEAGVAIRVSTEVRRLICRARRIEIVETSTGPIAAETVVVAAGSWAPALVRGLGVELLIEAGKGYTLDCRAPSVRLDVPVFLHGSRVAMTPFADRLRVAGTLEIAGLDVRVSRKRVQMMLNATTNAFPQFATADVAQPLVGLRPCTPDGLPSIGRVHAVDNLVVAAGHGMLGIALAPVTAAIVGAIVGGTRHAFDVGALRPDRFDTLLTQLRRHTKRRCG